MSREIGLVLRLAWRQWAGRILFLLLLVGIAALAGWVFLIWPLRPVGDGPAVEFEVRVGSSTAEVVQDLAKHGLIRDGRALLRWIRLTGHSRQIKAGWYRLSPSQGADGILAMLVRGTTLLDVFVVPEGTPLKEIAAAWESQGLGPREAFERACQVTAEKLGHSLEGYLFPDTYYLERHSSAALCIEQMLRRFQQQWARLEGEPAGGLSKHQVVTLASIVEREAKMDEERPLIAGIFHNRLRLGWKLQADTTVAYVLGFPDRPLRTKDLTVESVYNTYLYPGLPPGPICSPGFASLQAAYRPAQTSKMYFVAKGDGTHYFSETLAEHNRMRKEIRALMSP